jgi:hypothetical protein
MRVTFPTTLFASLVLVTSAAAQAKYARTTMKPAPSSSAILLVTLRGSDVVPPVATPATGTAELTIVGSEVRYQVHVDRIRDVTGAFIHIGGPGEKHPVVASLYEGLKPGRTSGLLARGTLRSRDLHGVGMTRFIRALRTNDTYLTVRTKARPGGEIRGEIRIQPSATAR